MLSSNLTLKDVAGADVVYTTVGFPTGGADRIDVASTTDNKGTLNIRHTDQGKGSSASTRHLVQFSRTKQDTTGVATATLNLTILAPQSSLIDSADIEDMIRQLVDLLVTTSTVALDTSVIEALLRGES